MLLRNFSSSISQNKWGHLFFVVLIVWYKTKNLSFGEHFINTIRVSNVVKYLWKFVEKILIKTLITGRISITGPVKYKMKLFYRASMVARIEVQNG